MAARSRSASASIASAILPIPTIRRPIWPPPAPPFDAGTLFAALSIKMVGRLAQWNRGEHFATIRTDWLSRAAGLGEVIRVRLADRELAGVFETLDDAGRLVLALPEGERRTIAAGDVVQFVGPGRSGSGEG